jgi:hypothetical protein
MALGGGLILGIHCTKPDFLGEVMPDFSERLFSGKHPVLQAMPGVTHPDHSGSSSSRGLPESMFPYLFLQLRDDDRS